MLSVVGRASTIVEAMQLGASDFLNKPFEEEELDLTLSRKAPLAADARDSASARNWRQASDSPSPGLG